MSADVPPGAFGSLGRNWITAPLRGLPSSVTVPDTASRASPSPVSWSPPHPARYISNKPFNALRMEGPRKEASTKIIIEVPALFLRGGSDGLAVADENPFVASPAHRRDEGLY